MTFEEMLEFCQDVQGWIRQEIAKAIRGIGGTETGISGGSVIGPIPVESVPAHASTHENGGGDEINVGGLSGELADPQPPKAHEITAHTATGGSPGDVPTVQADGSLALQAPAAGVTPADSVTTQAFGDAPVVGVSVEYAREDHKHGMPADPLTAHLAAGDPHSQYQKESEKGAANGYASLGADGKVPASQLPESAGSKWGVMTAGPDADPDVVFADGCLIAVEVRL